MNDRFKYIRFETEEGLDRIIIFSPTPKHSTIRRYFERWKPVSAGFVRQAPDGIVAYGDSCSLGVGSLDEDTDMMRKYFGKIDEPMLCDLPVRKVMIDPPKLNFLQRVKAVFTG